MRLQNIQLHGFKSFAHKHELSFEQPTTAIVGPNGSGKSNIVEAFRFVLGEQSMKSMRGRSGSDLIFKGSKQIKTMSRASVVATFDNSERKFKFTREGRDDVSLDYDQIVISREVYQDGSNTYKINNSEVRLKDIHELLASVHIGSSSHHIISQGQADRVLNASAKDRRAMIEDALGLKVYQLKLKDSEKRLEKTKVNIGEVESLRREIAPHIRFLKKQVEKIEKVTDMRTELGQLYREYFFHERRLIEERNTIIEKEKQSLSTQKQDLETTIAHSPKIEDHEQATEYMRKEVASLRQKQSSFDNEKSTILRKLAKVEALLEMAGVQGDQAQEKQSGDVVVTAEFVKDLEKQTQTLVSMVHSVFDTDALVAGLERLKKLVQTIVSRETNTAPANKQEDKTQEYQTQKQDLEQALSVVDQQIQECRKSIEMLEAKERTHVQTYMKEREELFSLKQKLASVTMSLEQSAERAHYLQERKQRFQDETQEAIALVGADVLQAKEGGKEFDEASHTANRRTIERLKIKLEDSGALGGEDVLREYQEVTERDEFLLKELADLEESLDNLKKLIEDLKQTLDTEFRNGVKKINEQFGDFFTTMFGGGNAFLSLVTQKPRKKFKNEDGEEEDLPDEDEEKNYEQGIDINVALPRKKVTDLAMLSGGERSLTSIALLFAMSQVNPPPFLVLDETDAALDEANSRRYGDMIARLSQYSQLIVVTHNRETMSRAQVLYGVTIGADGGSKLLSIKFDEAEQYAK
jgi:chromosome segregation protein